ncbi:AAA family ATPase [Mycolicibacterium cosmeticum]|uniref:AAA family ATPase n=1 Tax=Mycolicibacterium cosmeticum TaxID=258533 RepID=UPI003204EB9E
MRLKTLYVRFYRSFNYDYLRKSHPSAIPSPWDFVDGDLFLPFVRVPIERGITTVVGANESGKSQLLKAIEHLLTGLGIERRDFCRYSNHFTVGDQMLLPEFGGEFDNFDELQLDTVRQLAKIDDTSIPRSIHLFRKNGEVALFVEAESATRSDDDDTTDATDESANEAETEGSGHDAGWMKIILTEDQVRSLRLPTFFTIESKTPLPDNVPLAYLATTGADKDEHAIPRPKTFGWIKELLDQRDQFTSEAAIDQAKPALLQARHTLGAIEDSERDLLLRRLRLAEELLVNVSGIGREAFDQLSAAVKSHDGYANAIVAKMNDDLAAALNFRKWWSQDSDFAISLTLRDFHLVFTVRDRTGAEYTFSERSGGLSYFLSYFVQYLSHKPSGGQEILLMDEPDAYLSMQGQQDLLRIFTAFAHPEDPAVQPIQVVYVTHSPFLIDKNRGERIRVLEKGEGDEGTRLVVNAGRNHYEPLRSALGDFVAETAFISNCNLMVEGQADQVLLAGISSFARRRGTRGETLDLNTLSLVPSGSAEHVPYMVYLARGRDVDKPAVVVLLDGDEEADGVAKELKRGFRGRRHIDDDLVLRTSDIAMTDVRVDTDLVREIEDLVPASLAMLAMYRFADEVLSAEQAKAVRSAATELVVPEGAKLFKTLKTQAAALPRPVRLTKVGFARGVVEALETDAGEELIQQTVNNFEVLFTRIRTAQREAVRRNARERVRTTVRRLVEAFKRDHPKSVTRRDVAALLEDVTSQLVEASEENERLRSAIRKIRADFDLLDEPASHVGDLAALLTRLESLPYEGVLAVQTETTSTPMTK